LIELLDGKIVTDNFDPLSPSKRAFKTLIPASITSVPIPSPGIAAIL
jgi:hypothetical protein